MEIDPTSADRGPVRGPGRRQVLALGLAGMLAACTSRADAPAVATTDATADGGPGPASSTPGGDSGTTMTAGSSSSTPALASSVGPTTSAASAQGSVPLTAADFASAGTCRLLPEQTAGPFPLDEQLVRRDITEGLPGHPLRLGIRVVDASCAPLAGAAVEVWHADATGDYSAFVDNGGGKDDGPGTTFLRGTQLADDDGITEFATIYPGWYRGRAVHVHLRVRVADELVLTSQLYFPDDATLAILAEPPYAEFGPPDTTNTTDGLAGVDGGVATNGTLLTLTATATERGPGTLAVVNVAVDV